MKTIPNNRFAITGLVLSLLLVPGFAPAQDSPGNGGWRRVGDPPPAQAPDTPGPSYPDATYSRNQAPYPNANTSQAPYSNPAPNQAPYPNASQPPYPNQPSNGPTDSSYSVPPQLTVKPGTYVTVRVNQVLSSDHNQAGDAFSATLVQPLVVDGVVVAQRGQTLGGRVDEARKAGRVEGVSRLRIQLTDMSLVDGQQVPIQTQLIDRTGSTAVGRDAGAIAGTTAVGAAAGAAADWGRGAAIGAGAGAAAGIIGVLLTRGHPTMIYPESVLTFRVEAPIAVSTDRAPQAFRYVDPSDYQRASEPHLQMRQPVVAAAPVPYPYYGPRYYPYYYGSGFSFYYGSRFYGPRYYGRGGYRTFRR